MEVVQKFIESGILQVYVFGMATPEEAGKVEYMSGKHTEIRKTIEKIEHDFEAHLTANAITPDPTIKPLLVATIDYTERMKNGEASSYPRPLHENSRIEDYEEWLKRTDMQLPDDFTDFYVKIINYTAKALTAIIWIKNAAPLEMHDHEFERLLIVEGTCDIVMEDTTQHLKPGNYFSIPLHTKHTVQVTSAVTCKAILQRVAA